MKKDIQRLLIVLLASVALIVLVSVQKNAENQAFEKEWEKSFIDAYGSTLSDFYILGNSDFQARWLTEKEEAEYGCRWTEHCVILKLATIADCQNGAVVEFDVFDSSDEKIASEKSPVFSIEIGEIAAVELGSVKLNEKGFIEPTDAYCSDSLPAV